jgi:hypothetical protein
MINFNFIRNLIVFSLVFTLISCEKENHPGDYHLVITHEVTEITAEGATMHGEITFNGDEPVREYGFIWGSKYDAYPIDYLSHSVMAELKDEKFSLRVDSKLKKDANYVVRAYVKTDTRTVYGNRVKFKSLGSIAESL